MQRRVWLSLTLILSIAAVSTTLAGSTAAAVPQRAAPETVGMSAARLERITDLMRAYVEAGELAAVETIIARRGQIVFHEAVGTLDLETGAPYEPDSLVRIYSMSKPIVSVAAMILYEEGRFQLDDPVGDHIPELADLKVLVRGTEVDPVRPVTVRHLLTHTSGFRYGFDRNNVIDQRYREAEILANTDLDEMIERLADIPLAFHPGERFNYGISTDVLGALVERVSGVPLDEFLAERIFVPLEMSDTTFAVPDSKLGRFGTNHRINRDTGELEVIDSPREGSFVGDVTFFSGGGGLVSTASDYIRFCMMMLNGGELDGTRVLSPKTVEFIQQNHMRPEVNYGANGGHFGLGFAVTMRPGSNEIGSIGTYSWVGAAGTIFWIDPVEDLAVVTMIQLMASPYPLRQEMQALTYGALTELNQR